MICKNCGAYVEDGTKFCTSCGASVDATTNNNPPPFEPTGSYYSAEQPQARVLSAEDPEAYRVAGSSLTFGILSVCFSWLSILGVIFGIVGITKMRKAGRMGSKSPKKYVGLGLSIYGIIASIAITIYLIYVFGMLAFVLGMAKEEYDNGRNSGELTDAEIERIINDIEEEFD